MADKKITDLPEIPEVADDDYLEIVDTSANTSNKISRENLIAGHDHDSDYLGISAKAADSDKLDGIDSTGFVQTSGDQTIAGIKTFSSFPVTPSSAPSSDYQTANKKYVDDSVSPLGAWASWTPTITWAGGTTNPTSFTILAARYVTVGNLVFCMLKHH